MSQNNNCRSCDSRFADNLEDLEGKTVTIFTECGGQCGCGFTGVIVKVNRCFVRLVACIGSTPSCALGNSCGKGFCSGFDRFDDFDDFGRFGGFGGVGGASFGCRNRRNKLGSVVDIPIDKICAVVRNSI